MKSLNQYITEFVVKKHIKKQDTYKVYRKKNTLWPYIILNSLNDLPDLYDEPFADNLTKSIGKAISYDKTKIILLTPRTWKQVHPDSFNEYYEETDIEITPKEFNKETWTKIENELIKK